jgi:hypothetical protein
MNNRWVRLVAVAVLGSLVLAACSKSSAPAASAGAAVSTIPTAPPSTGTQGSNPLSGFCTELKAENTKASALGSTFGAAVASHNLTKMKQALGTFFTNLSQELAAVEAQMASAPSNVQAALKVVNQFFTQLQSEVANASSLQGLEASMAASGNSPALKAAGKTLDDYGKSQCGDISSPTP